MKRFAAVQAWPMLRNFAAIAPSTARSRSASSKTTNGALPPSSIEVRRTLTDACCSSFWPTGVEPVKESLRSRGSAMIGPDTALEVEVVNTLTTPLGSPASSRSFAKSSVVSGVSSAGLITTVQPAASAGATLRVAMASGKFHGVIRKHGPTGCWDTIMRPVPSGLAPYRPCTRGASSANHRRNSPPYATSPRASARGLPISIVISSAKSSLRSCSRSNARRRISPRTRAGVAAHEAAAAAAASSAFMPSSGEAFAIVLTVSPVAGS